MDTAGILIALLTAACIPVGVFWWLRWRTRNGPDRCPECEIDLRGRRLHADFEGHTRCPKCGERVQSHLRLTSESDS